jgi:hypothetical protein
MFELFFANGFLTYNGDGITSDLMIGYEKLVKLNLFL